MFTYFKGKQQAAGEVVQNNSSLETKKEPSLSSQKKQENRSNNVLNLPYDIMSQLMNQTKTSLQQQPTIKLKDKRQTDSNILKENQNIQSTNQVKEKQMIKQKVIKSDEIIQNRRKTQQKDNQSGQKIIKSQELLREIARIKQNKVENINLGLDRKQSKHHEKNTENFKIETVKQEQLDELISSVLQVLFKVTELQLVEQPIKVPQLIKTLKLSTLSAIRQISADYYESFILQTKEKYNYLVDQSTNLFAKSRQIANFINEFILSINLFFQTQELLVPAQEIQNAIAQLNPVKTQKYINYLIKIFENNFDQVIQGKINNIKTSLQNELRNSQKRIKQLQIEINKINNIYKQKETVFNQNQAAFELKQGQIMRLKKQIQEQKSRIIQLSTHSKQKTQDFNSELLLLKRQLQRAKKQFQDSQEKQAKLHKIIQKKDIIIKQKQQEIEKLSNVIKQVQKIEFQGMENIVQEMQIKEKMFQDKIQRFNNDRINLEHKIRQLALDNQTEKTNNIKISKQCEQLKRLVDKLKLQLQTRKEADTSSLEDKEYSHPEINKMSEQNEEQCQEVQKQKVDFSKLVNKEIMGHLFLSFDDESKEWTVRNNIRNQIKIILGLDGKEKTTTENQLNLVKSQKSVQNQSNMNKQTKPNIKSNEGSIIGKFFGW